VLFQAAVPAPAADYEIEYLLSHTQLRDARRTVTDTLRAAQFRGGRLLTSKSLSTAGLPEGDYRLVMNLRRLDQRDVVLASSNTGFHLVANAPAPTLYFDPNARKLAQPAMAAYIRALAALAHGEPAAAKVYLRQAVDQNPKNVFADTHLIDLYYRGRQFDEVTRLYDRLGMAPFEGSAESMAQISLSLWNLGQQGRAREVLQSARATFPGDPLVAALAKTVH
jgi:tetratricopeptide (TPR) repeat protein